MRTILSPPWGWWKTNSNDIRTNLSEYLSKASFSGLLILLQGHLGPELALKQLTWSICPLGSIWAVDSQASPCHQCKVRDPVLLSSRDCPAHRALLCFPGTNSPFCAILFAFPLQTDPLSTWTSPQSASSLKAVLMFNWLTLETRFPCSHLQQACKLSPTHLFPWAGKEVNILQVDLACCCLLSCKPLFSVALIPTYFLRGESVRLEFWPPRGDVTWGQLHCLLKAHFTICKMGLVKVPVSQGTAPWTTSADAWKAPRTVPGTQRHSTPISSSMQCLYGRHPCLCGCHPDLTSSSGIQWFLYFRDSLLFITTRYNSSSQTPSLLNTMLQAFRALVSMFPPHWPLTSLRYLHSRPFPFLLTLIVPP